MLYTKPTREQQAWDIRKQIDKYVSGKIEADHGVWGHEYILPSGKRVKSVTSKLIIEKPHLRKWAVVKGVEWMEKEDRFNKLKTADDTYRKELLTGASLAHTDIRDEAGFVGTSAHNIIEEYLKVWIDTGSQPSDIRKFAPKGTDPRAIAAIRSAERLFTKHDVLPVATEMLVGTDKWGGIAGTLDLLAFFGDKLYVSDWKTSNAVADDYAIQVSAYMYAFLDMTQHRIPVAGCNLVKLSKDYDKIELYDIPYPTRAFRAYKNISGVYDWLENKKKKLVKHKKTKKI